jgi:MFS family permease
MGYGIISIGMFLVGPSQLLRIIDSEIVMLIGLCIMGLGCGMIIIPVMPDMIEAAQTRYPQMAEEMLHNKISGIFIASQGLGETLGPVLGSIFEELVGFRSSQDIIAITLLVFMVVYYLACGKMEMFKRLDLGLSKVEEPLLSNISSTIKTPQPQDTTY